MSSSSGDAPPHELAARAFRGSFDADPDGVWAAPGRINLIGEHVDYNGGLCLPVALAQRTAAAVRVRDDDVLRVTSTHTGEPWQGRLADVGPGAPPGWPAYVAGVVWAVGEAGHDVPGLDVAVASAVPVGAGLSSSAALECSVALAVADLLGLPTDDDGRTLLAAACVRAENEVAGAPTGGMDQAASLLARRGHALLLDCRSGGYEHVPLGLAEAGLALLVIDTRAPHRLVDGQYAARRSTCDDAARRLGVASLREVSDVEGGALADDEQRRRVRHVVTEIARVSAVAHLLRAGRVGDVGPVLDASHESLRDDYAVSSAELDLAVEAARAAGALGARMTGGGFGGSAVALVPTPALHRVRDAVTGAFSRNGFTSPGFLVAEPSDGAVRVA